ncbi:MAG: hypothetical protein ACK46X_11090 [Candidatus Sericytochromatia bacterium]
MSFDEERLSILQRVSNGELTPQEGQLEIAMLKVKHERAHDEPGLERAEPMGQYQDGARQQMPPFGGALPFKLSGPIAVALALPFLMIGGLLLVGLGLFLAFPTYLGVSIYNQVAATHPGWPLLGFWPTLGTAMVIVSIVTVLNWRRRIRALIQTQTTTRPFGEQ